MYGVKSPDVINAVPEQPIVPPANPNASSSSDATIESFSTVPADAPAGAPENVIVQEGRPQTYEQTLSAIQANQNAAKAAPSVTKQPGYVAESPTPPPVPGSKPLEVRGEPVSKFETTSPAMFGEGEIRSAITHKQLADSGAGTVNAGPSFLRKKLPETVDVRKDMGIINRMAVEKDMQPAEYLTNRQWVDLAPLLSLSTKGRQAIKRHQDEKIAVDSEIKAWVDAATTLTPLTGVEDKSIQTAVANLSKKYKFAGYDYIFDRAKEMAGQDKFFIARSNAAASLYNQQLERKQKQGEKTALQQDRMTQEINANRGEYRAYLMTPAGGGHTQAEAEQHSDPANILDPKNPNNQADYENWAGTHRSMRIDENTGKSTWFEPSKEIKERQLKEEQRIAADQLDIGTPQGKQAAVDLGVSPGAIKAKADIDKAKSEFETRIKTELQPPIIHITGSDLDRTVSEVASRLSDVVTKQGGEISPATILEETKSVFKQDVPAAVLIKVADATQAKLTDRIKTQLSGVASAAKLNSEQFRGRVERINKDYQSRPSPTFADQIDKQGDGNYEQGIDNMLRATLYPGTTTAEQHYIETAIRAIHSNQGGLFADFAELRSKIARDYMVSVQQKEEEQRKLDLKRAEYDAAKKRVEDAHKGMITVWSTDPNDITKEVPTFFSANHANLARRFEQYPEEREALLNYEKAYQKKLTDDSLKAPKLEEQLRQGRWIFKKVYDDSVFNKKQMRPRDIRDELGDIDSVTKWNQVQDQIVADYGYNDELKGKLLMAASEGQRQWETRITKQLINESKGGMLWLNLKGDDAAKMLAVAYLSDTPEEATQAANALGINIDKGDKSPLFTRAADKGALFKRMAIGKPDEVKAIGMEMIPNRTITEAEARTIIEGVIKAGKMMDLSKLSEDQKNKLRTAAQVMAQATKKGG
ncbi:MAG: hypothetical protein PHD04_02855 [Candidatus Pacebacteria bacterium]|nr:hypothetical protein [Candidatus Paceibacterota bacterium]